jgi:hypothetical protein
MSLTSAEDILPCNINNVKEGQKQQGMENIM